MKSKSLHPVKGQPFVFREMKLAMGPANFEPMRQSLGRIHRSRPLTVEEKIRKRVDEKLAEILDLTKP